MKNFIQDTTTITVTVSSAVAGGAPLKVGQIFGVVHESVTAEQIAAGDNKAVLNLKGVFTLPKVQADTVAQGALLYWNNSSLKLTTTATGNLLVGAAWEAAGNTSDTVVVGLNEGFRANEA